MTESFNNAALPRSECVRLDVDCIQSSSVNITYKNLILRLYNPKLNNYHARTRCEIGSVGMADDSVQKTNDQYPVSSL